MAWLIEEMDYIKIRPIKITLTDEDGWIHFVYEDTGEADVIEKEEVFETKEKVLKAVKEML